MSHSDSERERARDAFRLANDLMLDLITGVQAYRTFQHLIQVRAPNEPVRTGVNRLSLWFIIVTLSKWIEYYDRYHAIITPDVRKAAKDLKLELESRGIRDFRNKVVGHIWDKKASRPLTTKEVVKRLDRLLGSDIPGFLLWVNNKDANVFPRTVVSVIERVKDRLAEMHGFGDEDVYN